ncbi:MAG: hypothetical protein ACRDJM_10985 [Actinomycetota bacterium]
MDLDRREFLRASGLVVLGAAAAACSDKGENKTTGTLEELTRNKQNTMTVVPVQPPLARANERLSIGLISQQGTPLSGGTAKAWLARTRKEKANGPIELVYHGDGFDGRGTYIARVTFAAEGDWLMYAEARPHGSSKTLTGATTLRVGERLGPPSGPKQPIPGERAISVPTPTTANPRSVKPICTRKPACTMHAVSLDQALKAGKPTVLIIGTPAFCETRYCGPVVDELMKVQAGPNGKKMSFVHVELYKDDVDAPATKDLAPAAAAWHVEAEPVIYYINKAGTIADWAVGASDAAEITQSANALL